MRWKYRGNNKIVDEEFMFSFRKKINKEIEIDQMVEKGSTAIPLDLDGE